MRKYLNYMILVVIIVSLAITPIKILADSGFDADYDSGDSWDSDWSSDSDWYSKKILLMIHMVENMNVQIVGIV